MRSLHAAADGHRLLADQSVAQDGVGGVASIYRASGKLVAFSISLLLTAPSGSTSVLSITPAKHGCTPLHAVAPHVYAATWKLAPKAGNPPTATGDACASIATAQSGADVTIEIMECNPPTAELAALAAHKQVVPIRSFVRLVDALGTRPSAARVAALLAVRPLVVAWTVGGDDLTVRVTEDGRRIEPCRRGGVVAVGVWQTGGRHAFRIDVANAAGRSTSQTSAEVVTTVAGVRIGEPPAASAIAVLARRTGRPASDIRRTLALLTRANGVRAACGS